MTTIANKVQLNFEPRMPVALDATGDTETLEALRVRLGGLSLIRYKPAKLEYIARTAGTAAGATLKLMNGQTVVASRTLDLSGTVSADSFDVDLSEVSGEAGLSVMVTVDSAGGASESLELDARLTIEPITAIFN